jgi:hypothetical protein
MRTATLTSATSTPETTADALSIRPAEVLRILRTAGGSLLLQAPLHGQLLRVEWAEKSRLLKIVMATLLDSSACWA